MKHVKLVITLLTIVALKKIGSLNILAILPYQGKSHFLVHRVYIQQLVKRGHNVTVISHFPEKTPPQNYHEVSLTGSIKILEDDLPFHKSYLRIFVASIFLSITGNKNCEVMLGNKNVKNLIIQKPKFDVAIVEQFNSDCGLGIAYKLGAPVVGITSHVLMPWNYIRFGIPYDPAYIPFNFLGCGSSPSLYQRVERTIFYFYIKTIYYIVSQCTNQKTLAKYFDDIPPLEDLASEIKVMLLYQNFILTGPRLFPANVIEVGGYHVSEAKPLTGSLLQFIEKAEYGVIYISFGSVIKCSTMPDDKLKAMLDAISELPQRFIWKWESKTMLLDENKLFLATWLPQFDILGHPKTLAFLSHAGMGGTTEAIQVGVPVVAMPIFGDQPSNAAAIEESGLGVQLQIENLTKENLISAFKKVLDPQFRSNVKRLSKAWHDRRMSPLDTAVYWTELVARNPNATYKTAAVSTSLYEYWCLDIISVFIIMILMVYIVIRFFLKLISFMKIEDVKQTDKKDVKKRAKYE